jgi:hypothetical protein
MSTKSTVIGIRNSDTLLLSRMTVDNKVLDISKI